MELRTEVQQPIEPMVGVQELVPPWLRWVALDSERSLGEHAPRPYSYMAACECPYDCPRDHENE